MTLVLRARNEKVRNSPSRLIKSSVKGQVVSKLIFVILLAAAVVFFVTSVFKRKKSDVVIENYENQPNRNVFLMLLLCIISTLVILFILSRFGVSIANVAQKFLAFLPFIRGLLPF